MRLGRLHRKRSHHGVGLRTSRPSIRARGIRRPRVPRLRRTGGRPEPLAKQRRRVVLPALRVADPAGAIDAVAVRVSVPKATRRPRPPKPPPPPPSRARQVISAPLRPVTAAGARLGRRG